MNTKLHNIMTFLIVVMAICSLSGCSGKVEQKTEKDYSNIEMNPNISIPGYESLEFKAGKTKQNVDFYNPDENTCFFRISLVLKSDDGSKVDGTAGDSEAKEEALWTSELIEPGEEVKSIKLSKEFESGDYSAMLKYECFSLKDETPLNGSNIELTLNVR